MPLVLLLVSLLGAAGLGFPDLPPVPDLVETAENSIHVQLNFSVQTVEEPTIWLPTIAEIEAMSDEERTYRFHWFLFVFVLVFFSAVVAGTLVMVVGAEAKEACHSFYRYHALGHTAQLSKKAQIQMVVLSLVVTASLSFAASIWSLQTGRLSKKLGLDWEVYLFLFCCGCFSLLIQSLVAVAWLQAGDRFDATAFAVASMSVLPFVSDQSDTLKDIIFGALCVQSEHWAMKVLGVFSWLYLLAVHAWFVMLGAQSELKAWFVYCGLLHDEKQRRDFPGANCFSELATSHLAVLLMAPKVDGESSVGFWEGTILPALYKQLTPSKREYLLIENLPQAVLSLFFLCFEGGSMFVVVLNVAVPAIHIGVTFLAFKPVRAAAAPALGKAVSRAVHSGNLIAARTIWLEAEVGRDLSLFKQMMPHLRFLLDLMERSGFKELDKLSEEEIKLWQGIAGMFAEARCDLSQRKIGDSGAKVVAEAMKHTAMAAMESLELQKDDIGDEGAKALGEGLKVNNTLWRLYLNENSIGDAGAQALADGLKQNNTLEKLWLQRNSIGDAGAQALAEGLKVNKSLQILELCANSIGDAGAQALAAAITENRSLRKLGLDRSLRRTPGGQALEAAEKAKKERGEDVDISWLGE